MIKYVRRTEADSRELSRLTIRAEDLADDFSDYSKVVVRKPWGYEYLIFGNDQVAVWILHLDSGAQTSMHCHPRKKTSLVVLEGDVVCSTLAGDVARSAGDGLLVDEGVFHQTTCVSEQGAFVMEVETPVNKRDLVRLRDRYGRAGQGYERAEHYSRNTQNYNYLTLSGPEIYHNQKKRFGSCTLTFKRLECSAHLNEIARENRAEDVICVLRGQLVTPNGVIGLGDTAAVGDLEVSDSFRFDGVAELLLIKRIDNMIKVSDVVVDFIKSQGAREVFVVPGDSNVHLLDSIGRDESLHFIAHQLEHGAAMAAEAYSKVNGENGFLIISSGASGPNAMTAVANCWVDSTPLFVISGQARSDQDSDGRVRQLGNKALNITDIVSSITKYAVKVTDPAQIRFELEKAAHLSRSERPGPVWVDIPIDVLGATVDRNELVSYVTESTTPHHQQEFAQQVDRVVAMIAGAERPVILLGNGIRISGGEKKALDVINTLGIPVLTSRRGMDLIEERHPLFFGRPGTFGQRRANFILQNADLLLSVGSRLSIPLIGRNTAAFCRAAKKVVVDVDPNELCKATIRPDLAIRCRADEFFESLRGRQVTTNPQLARWIERCRDWSRDFPPLAEGYAHNELINPNLFIHELSRQLSPGDCIVIDGGAVNHRSIQVFEIQENQRIISSTGLELPGFALAGAIGARIATRTGRVICLCEDRGFTVSAHELQTIAHNKLSILIFVLKSKGLSAVRSIQKDFFGARFVGTDADALFGSPSLAGIGRAYGIRAVEMNDVKEFPSQIRELLQTDGPLICEVTVDIEQELAPRLGFIVKSDGKWIAKPLEDMYPFLDREVLKRNMLIELFEED